MKKNKTVAYMLATTLLLGGTFLGTKALFTDTATSKNSLILTTGKVDIEVNEDAWLRNVKDTNNDGKINAQDRPYNQGCEQSAEGTFSNVQPGDTFMRYINVLNQESTYDVSLKIEKEITNNNEELMKFIKIEDNILTELPAKANSGGYITVKIENTDAAWKAFNGAGQLDLNATYTIEATQK